MDMIEEYEERKRLRRSRFRWRIIAALAVLAVIALIIARKEPSVEAHIARYSVEGVITDNRKRDKVLKEIAEDDSIEALILSIDSPGGGVVGSEVLYETEKLLRRSRSLQSCETWRPRAGTWRPSRQITSLRAAIPSPARSA